MEKKFEFTLKDIIYLVSIVFALLGGWYSLQMRVREFELKVEADKQILEIKLQTLQSKIAEMSAAIVVQNQLPLSVNKKGTR